jgi:hypothetical protein
VRTRYVLEKIHFLFLVMALNAWAFSCAGPNKKKGTNGDAEQHEFVIGDL